MPSKTLSSMGSRTKTGDSSGDADEAAQILSDQDLTSKADISTLDENMGAKSVSLENIEDESADFMRGEVDVKEQMDRASSAMEDSILGLELDEEDPYGELNATYRSTPGGLDDVIKKTDEAIRRSRLH